jgi:hypothetical protein
MEKTPDKHLVLLSLGYWAKYAMPVDAATQVMSLMVKSGAVRAESESIAGEQRYRPQKPDMSVSVLDYQFLADCPMDDVPRKEYLAWIKTKYELIGNGYAVESYAAYLAAKEEET